MSKSAFPGSPDHAATLRRMNFLVALLVVSNIATGIFSVYLLHKVDQRYSRLIGYSVPVLNDLRELISDTEAAVRATNPRNFSTEVGKPAEALQKARAKLVTEEKFRAETTQAGRFDGMLSHRDAIQRTGAEFNRISLEVCRLFETGDVAAAGRFREEKLLGAFDGYIDVIGKAADAVEQQSLSASKDYTERTHSLTTIVLGVAGWPLIAMMALLLLTVCFVVVLMFVFRGKELGDMP